MAPPITIPDPSTLGMVAHNNQGYVVIVTVVVCFLIATPAAVGRIYTRKFIVGQLWIDDYLAILAWVCLLIIRAKLQIRVILMLTLADLNVCAGPNRVRASATRRWCPYMGFAVPRWHRRFQ